MPEPLLLLTHTLNKKQGGNCHMGRAAAFSEEMSSVSSMSRCKKIYSNYTHVVARCLGATRNTYVDYEMKKEKSAAPDNMVEVMRTQRRQKCNTCSKPPIWKAEFNNEPLPHGPEVSYGIPFRWSAGRLLAADMRAAVCGSRHNTTKECDKLLNLDKWTPEQFMQRYMTGTMPELVAEGLRDQSFLSVADAIANASGTMTDADEEEFLWTGAGWVACSQYNTTCYGGVKKSEWYNRETRGASCNRVFAEEAKKGNVNSTAVGLDICNLNSKMEGLCRQLRVAQACSLMFLEFMMMVGECVFHVFYSPPDLELVLPRDAVRRHCC